jgi:hypothetical protein
MYYGRENNYSWSWTKGLAALNGDGVAEYTIKIYDNVPYLFLQHKSGDYSIRAEKPRYTVFTRY